MEFRLKQAMAISREGRLYTWIRRSGIGGIPDAERSLGGKPPEDLFRNRSGKYFNYLYIWERR